ncbi:MAG: aconitase X catalytic domain-containing protein [Nitrososphaerota archaeon]|nr:aconitase X catalytic domain-containing protein [Nitrososphaerota archaeon]MDG6919750.1 aconitase X catalytic domain-containing protein [Nitrososphaerota archaeon]MDG6946054.1 aconitase X catalytic domain-containing protein [Nitrososphaerota archaeon]
MQLNRQEERALRGEEGRARQLAMEILTKVGDAMGADSLVPISSAHVLAHYSSLHEAGIDMLEKFQDGGGRFAVKTSVDPASVDPENWRSFGVPEEFAEKQFELFRAYEALGGTGCWTCVQYQTCNIPRRGEILAWAESNAVVYANSLLGCRTNKITSGLDLACALTGLTPRYGMLLDENRVARVAFKLSVSDPSDLDYRSAGFYIGRHCGSKVPVLSGLPKSSTSDSLKHLGSAAATGGPVTMIHFVGFTPGCDSVAKATGGEKVEVIDIGRREMEEVEGELNQTDEKADLVALGVPQLSHDELSWLAGALAGRRLRRGSSMYVYTSKQAYDEATESGVRRAIEASGARLTHSTDGEISPLKEMGFRTVLTNSAKLAETIMSEGEIRMRYAPLKDIIAEATS